MINDERVSKENSCASDFVRNLFEIDKFKLETELIDPFLIRKLNELELNLFEISSYEKDVFTSFRLSNKKQIYHSVDYQKLKGNKGSYVIKYNVQDEFNFGLIKYFIQIDDYFYVAVNPFIIKNNCFIKDVKVRLPDNLKELKIKGYFENHFFICQKTDHFYLINSKDIISKCISYEFSDGNEIFVCEYRNEKEHD